MPTGSPGLKVAAASAIRLSAGKAWAYWSPRASVARTTRQPRAISSRASAWAGNRCPPVPPAASTASRFERAFTAKAPARPSEET